MYIDFEAVKEYAYSHLDNYLERDGSGQGYVCPICGSGSGQHGTGITTRDGVHFTCWAGCFTNADIIDIIGLQYGLTTYQEKIKAVADVFGYSETTHELPAPKKVERPKKEPPTQQEIEQKQEANRKLIALGQAHIRETDYLEKRGITLPYATFFHLGYVPNYRGYGEAVIIPTNMENGNHIARFLSLEAIKGKYDKKYYYAGSREMFNGDILYTSDKPIVITEGELDAISICVAGGKAIGLGGVYGKNKLIERIKAKAPSVPLVIALDNDNVGRENANKLMQELANMGYSNYIRANLYGNCKDANEALTSDKATFTSTIQAINKAKNIEELHKVMEKLNYIDTSAGSYVLQFMTDIQESRNTTPYIPTGFKKLDAILEGGLYEGVHYIGALSSLGKTTFVMQIADNVAKGQIDYTDPLQEKFPPTDVLIFSLEMSKRQLIAKSISRETYLYCERNKLDKRKYAKTSRGITVGKRYAYYSQQELDVIDAGAKTFAEYGKHIFIRENNGNCDTAYIRSEVEKHIANTNRKPLVIIDYLQILTPGKDRLTDKQATDLNVVELKNISKQFAIPIICISSINRDNYNAKISMQAFKESGNIEFSSDVLIGLQFSTAGSNNFDVDTERAKSPRDIQLVILKNRDAAVNNKIKYNYLPKFNFFEEQE